MAPTLFLGLLSSNVILMLRLGKSDQRPPSFSLTSKRSGASSLKALPTAFCEFLSPSHDRESGSYNNAEIPDSSSTQSGPPGITHSRRGVRH